MVGWNTEMRSRTKHPGVVRISAVASIEYSLVMPNMKKLILEMFT